MSHTLHSIVFPGQGAQRVGMGQDFYASSPLAKQVYELASDTLHLDVADLCFNDADKLQLTEYAQPAILTTEIAMWHAFMEQSGIDATQCVFGGHSLGEYTALVAAGGLQLGDALTLVRERGRLMQQACPVGAGSMTAVIGDDLDKDAISLAIEASGAVIGNDNSANQIVLSGSPEALKTACNSIVDMPSENPEKQLFRFVDLAVSAAFHSPAMQGIEKDFSKALSSNAAELDAPACRRVVSNYSGGFHSGYSTIIRDALSRQVSGTVRWRDNMAALIEQSDNVVEIGPSNPLRGFFKSIGVGTQSITSQKSLMRWSEKNQSNLLKAGQAA